MSFPADPTPTSERALQTLLPMSVFLHRNMAISCQSHCVSTRHLHPAATIMRHFLSTNYEPETCGTGLRMGIANIEPTTCCSKTVNLLQTDCVGEHIVQ